jgi:hypothetical protein
VIGFDIEAHAYGEARYPGLLVLQDVRTLHGRQFKDAALIVGSSPCQEFSYRAMPWSRAKALGPPVLGVELFEAQFRIQREASEAAGRQVPMVVENVRGAQPYVGRAAWNFGSYYLWGDVPALMPSVRGGGGRARQKTAPGEQWNVRRANFSGSRHWDPSERGADGLKNTGGSWFAQGPRGEPGAENNARDGSPAEGRKGAGAGAEWFDGNLCRLPSSSLRRKAASAAIAKIPPVLSRHIARVYKPKAGGLS